MDRIINSTNETTYVVEKSKFICSIRYVQNIAEAKDFITEISKQHWNASHNCYAYIIDYNSYKFSDDGEPKGTAGLPIFTVLKNHNLVNVCVVITRYFGGKKLGSGGLIRAYSRATVEGLKNNDIIDKLEISSFEFELPITLYGKVSNFIQLQSINWNVDFIDDHFVATISDTPEKVEHIKKFITSYEVNYEKEEN